MDILSKQEWNEHWKGKVNKEITLIADYSRMKETKISGVVPFSIEVFIRNKVFRNILKKTIVPIISKLEDKTPNKMKDLFTRQVCIVMVKK